MLKWLRRIILAGCVLTAVIARAGLDGSYLVALDHTAIQYSLRPVDDSVTRLQQRIDDGTVHLEFAEERGYLTAVLQALDVSADSQVLVFSKTSFQAPRIAPRLPRALYFNDQVSVGWVRGGDVLEFAAVDPRQGVIFYTLDQDADSKPRFRRQDGCLQCHQSSSTLGVPGLLVRSVFPGDSGMPIFRAGTFVTDHRSPFKERWGGWYVSGTHGSQVHMGNSTFSDKQDPESLQLGQTQSLTDLQTRIDTGAYLSPHSDIVALMTLEHQTRMTNLITRVGFDVRTALHDNEEMNKVFERPQGQISESVARRIDSAVEELIEYLLFTDEAGLTEPVRGVSNFTQSFASHGPRDRRGRSLRDFDLQSRLFRYPCSYLIYSDAFDALPPEALTRVYRRLWEILSQPDEDPKSKYATLSTADRKAVLEILLETKNNLPNYWNADTQAASGL